MTASGRNITCDYDGQLKMYSTRLRTCYAEPGPDIAYHQVRVACSIGLRARDGMSGTDVAYVRRCDAAVPPCTCPVPFWPSELRVCYAMSGTDIGLGSF
eukprot:1197573-Rhodomonas_salina.3